MYVYKCVYVFILFCVYVCIYMCSFELLCLLHSSFMPSKGWKKRTEASWWECSASGKNDVATCTDNRKNDVATCTEETCTEQDKQKSPSQKVRKELYGQSMTSEEQFTNGHCCAHMYQGKTTKTRATQDGPGLPQFWLKGMSKGNNDSFRATFRPLHDRHTDDITWMAVLIGQTVEDNVFHRRMVMGINSDIPPNTIAIDDPWPEGDHSDVLGAMVEVHASQDNVTAICDKFVSDIMAGSASPCQPPLGTYVLRAQEDEVDKVQAAEWWVEATNGTQQPPHVLPSPVTRFIMGKPPVSRMILQNRCKDPNLHRDCEKRGIFCLWLTRGVTGRKEKGWSGLVYGEAPGCVLQGLDSISDPRNSPRLSTDQGAGEMTQSTCSNMSNPERQCGGRNAPYLPDSPLTDKEKLDLVVNGVDVTAVVQGAELKCGRKVWLAKFVDVGGENWLKCPACGRKLNGLNQLSDHFGSKSCK